MVVWQQQQHSCVLEHCVLYGRCEWRGVRVSIFPHGSWIVSAARIVSARIVSARIVDARIERPPPVDARRTRRRGHDASAASQRGRRRRCAAPLPEGATGVAVGSHRGLPSEARRRRLGAAVGRRVAIAIAVDAARRRPQYRREVRAAERAREHVP